VRGITLRQLALEHAGKLFEDLSREQLSLLENHVIAKQYYLLQQR
jgi:hypothetical protein